MAERKSAKGMEARKDSPLDNLWPLLPPPPLTLKTEL
jgi:hypothetical protein